MGRTTLVPLVLAVSFAGAELPVAFEFGWIYADLGLEDRPTQSWLGTMVAAEGRYSVTTAATPLDEPCSPGHQAPGEL